MNLLLARHGETKWNVESIFRGRVDIEMDETGIRQAELLGNYLKDFDIETVYSSPLKRALKTAEIIAGHHGLAVHKSDSLIDMDFGKWEGLRAEEVRKKYPALFEDWAQHPERARMPEGESLDDVRRRAMGLIDTLIKKFSRDVLLVSHRVVHKVLICALLGLDNSHFWNVRLDNCGLTTFGYERERFILVEHNNTSYLKPLKAARLGDF